MKLPAIPFLSKKQSQSYFLGLLYQFDKVTALLFKEENKSLSVVGTHEIKIDLENTETEDLIVSSDQAISRIEMSLPEAETVEKTIFSVPHFWVEEGRIRPERLAELKKISTELALAPMGFIVSIEAIVAYLQKKDGAPLSAIFIEVSERQVSVYVVRSGNIIEVKQAPIADSIEKLVEKLLASVSSLQVLPSKIILLNNAKAEHIQQKFLSHHWTKDLPFMHLPQVSILERGFEREAIVQGVANQMGLMVSGGVDLTTYEAVEEASPTEGSTSSFGFLKEQDVSLISEKKAEEEALPVEEPSLSFQKEESFTPSPSFQDESAVPLEAEDIETSKKGFSLPTLPAFGGFSLPNNPRSFVIPLIAAFVVVGVVAIYYLFMLKAEVVVFTDQKTLEGKADVQLSSSEESSFADKVLHIETVTEEVGGEKSIAVTGIKETGKSATGQVSIFNKTDAPKSLSKGTTLTSSTGLKFSLTEDVQVASTSSFSTSFSSKNANVEADDFGKEYNLPSNTNFTIEGIATSDLFARNETAFAGGTKEEKKVVSEKDMLSLEKASSDAFREEAQKKAESSLSQGQELLPTTLSTKFTEQKFDKKVGDEANNLKLTSKVSYTFAIYAPSEFEKFISSSDSFNVPDGFTLSDEDSEIGVSNLKEDDDNISATLSFNAIYKPQVSVAKIPAEIKGKTINGAQKTLAEIPGVAESNVILKNQIPFLPALLPFRAEGIAIKLESQE